MRDRRRPVVEAEDALNRGRHVLGHAQGPRAAAEGAQLGVLVGAVNQSGLFSSPEWPVLVPLLCLAGGLWLSRRPDTDPRLRWYLLAGSALFLTQYPRMDALRSYTINAAYAGFEEGIKGSLTVGKLADITVLSKDLLTIPDDQIPSTRVLFTIVGGKVQYTRPADSETQE